jgi:hypothetical protein
MAREPQPPPRKGYEAPKLLVYGDLAEMTKSGGSKGMADGKGKAMT